MAMRQCYGGPLDGAMVSDNGHSELTLDLATEKVVYSDNYEWPVFQVGGKRGCHGAAMYRRSGEKLQFVRMA